MLVVVEVMQMAKGVGGEVLDLLEGWSHRESRRATSLFPAITSDIINNAQETS